MITTETQVPFEAEAVYEDLKSYATDCEVKLVRGEAKLRIIITGDDVARAMALGFVHGWRIAKRI